MAASGSGASHGPLTGEDGDGPFTGGDGAGPNNFSIGDSNDGAVIVSPSGEGAGIVQEIGALLALFLAGEKGMAFGALSQKLSALAKHKNFHLLFLALYSCFWAYETDALKKLVFALVVFKAFLTQTKKGRCILRFSDGGDTTISTVPGNQVVPDVMLYAFYRAFLSVLHSRDLTEMCVCVFKGLPEGAVVKIFTNVGKDVPNLLTNITSRGDDEGTLWESPHLRVYTDDGTHPDDDETDGEPKISVPLHALLQALGEATSATEVKEHLATILQLPPDEDASDAPDEDASEAPDA